MSVNYVFVSVAVTLVWSYNCCACVPPGACHNNCFECNCVELGLHASKMYVDQAPSRTFQTEGVARGAQNGDSL